jgi:hypothetical protein
MDAIPTHSERICHCRQGLVSALLATVIAGGLSASLAAGASENPPGDFRLVVRPSICVSYDSEAPCEMAMQISWEGMRPADVCLKESMREPDIFCWQNARTGSVDVAYSDTSDVLYQLVEESSSFVLAEAEVIIINRDLRSARKRRRHVWSIL